MSEVAILVPVLDRPHRIEPLLESIAEATDVPYRVLFGCSDQPTVDELDRLDATYIRDDGGDEGTYPKRINRLFNETNEPYVFLGADDLQFHADWFRSAARVMDQMPNGFGVVAVNDKHNGAGVHFLVSRRYIMELGGCICEPGIVLHEGYKHAYCDDELRITARCHGRFDYAKHSVVEHLHVGNGKAPNDSTYILGNASMAQGAEVYKQRAHLWQ